jgi:hypothetical protein
MKDTGWAKEAVGAVGVFFVFRWKYSLIVRYKGEWQAELGNVFW